MEKERYDKLFKIKEEVLGLINSPLYNYRTENKYHPVIGEGNHFATILFVGEAPGRNEAEQGRPFCGAAGKILDELLAHAGIDRKTVYVTNIVKDRPPENRDPTPDEIALYSPFLDRQINIIQPKIIATLGRYSMAYIMNRFNLSEQLQTISRIHGKKFTTNASAASNNDEMSFSDDDAAQGIVSVDRSRNDRRTIPMYGEIAVIPFYHPAVATYQRSLLGEMKKDFLILKEV